MSNPPNAFTRSDFEDGVQPNYREESDARTSPTSPLQRLTTSHCRAPCHPFDYCEGQSSELNASGAQHNSLVLWPVILRGGFSGGNGGRELAISGQSTQRLAESLKDRSLAQSNICLLRDLFDYHFVACNGPLVYQQMLEQMSGRFLQVTAPAQPGGTIDVGRFESAVFEDAPTLHFLIGSLTRMDDWPQLQSSTATQPSEISLASILCDELGDEDCVVHAGEADFAQCAIEAGIKSWLTVLHGTYPFDRWDVIPQADDRVGLCIALQDARRPYMYIPLRSYQLGVTGVERVLTHMSGLARLASGGMQSCSIQ